MIKQSSKNHKNRSNTFYALQEIVIILCIIIFALSIRSLLFEPFRIPSGSMKPNLLVGDIIIVNKYAYGFSRHSFPFSAPIIKNRIFYKQPKRGDVVVFRIQNGGVHYVKRIIGTPGDSVQIIDGYVFVNNKRINTNDLGINFCELEKCTNQYIEHPYSNLSSNILDTKNGYIIIRNPNNLPALNNTEKFAVPKDSFFVMGDNRNNSQDSRFISIGYVHKDKIVGKAKLVLFSINKLKDGGDIIRKGRLFKIIYN